MQMLVMCLLDKRDRILYGMVWLGQVHFLSYGWFYQGKKGMNGFDSHEVRVQEKETVPKKI